MNKNLQSSNSLNIWISELHRQCKSLYLIDTNDMGFDEDQLKISWEQGSTPFEMAEHFGRKYNLTTAEEIMLRGKPSSSKLDKTRASESD